MCGRYTLTVNAEQLAEAFHLPVNEFKSLSPRYNIAPSQPVPILVQQQKLTLDIALWGLIPSWAKDPSIGARMINARRESLKEKPSFRGLLRNQRCLVLADGFYEWQKVRGEKVPHYIHLKSKEPFGFAGLWSHWMSPDGSEIHSCTIITGPPNDLIAPIHNRMPMILNRESGRRWLDPTVNRPDDLLSLLDVYPAREMNAYPVSRLVNQPENDSPECLLPA